MTTNNSNGRSPGFWMNLINSFRITWRLMWDRRVPAGVKLIPFLTIPYIFFPLDFITDFVPVLGQMDDLAIVLLGIQLFIALSPKDIVKRIRDDIEGRPPDDGWTVTGSRPHASGEHRSSASKDIVDG